METVSKSAITEKLKVLVVGNNPIELGYVFNALQKIRNTSIITEIAFDFKTIIQRLVRFSPHYILIDDNIGKLELKNAVRAFHNERKTKDVPITILKSSNYHEAINNGVMNYVLKESLTGETLHRALKNSMKSIKTHLYLQKAYKKRKGQLMRLLVQKDSF